MEEEAELKVDIDGVRPPFPTVDVVTSMTERFITQFRLDEPFFKAKGAQERQLEVGKMLFPPHWIEVAHEWSSAHHVSIGHCIMALMHLQRICGYWWDKRELRTILDKAFEEAMKNR